MIEDLRRRASRDDDFATDPEAFNELAATAAGLLELRLMLAKANEDRRQAAARVAALEAENDRLRRDAARYSQLMEPLNGLIEVLRKDVGLEPCSLSMAPAERYIGLVIDAIAEAAPKREAIVI